MMDKPHTVPLYSADSGLASLEQPAYQIQDLSPQDQTDIEEVLKLLYWTLITAPPNNSTIKRYKDFANGEHWGALGEYWTGKVPSDGVMLPVKKSFVRDDQIGPALERFTSGLLGKDPEFMIDGPETEGENATSLEIEANTWLAEFERKSEMHQKIRIGVKNRMPTGKVGIRVFVPRRYSAVLEGTVALEDALKMVQIITIDAEDCGRIYDQDGIEIGCYYRYYSLDPVDRRPYVEVHMAKYIIQGFIYGPQIIVSSVIDNPLFGLNRDKPYLLYVNQRMAGSVLTESIIEKQQALNKDYTMLGRNSDTAGFRQIILINASTTDEADQPIPFKFGPAVVSRLVGIPIADKETGFITGYTTPSFQTVEPVNPATLLDTIHEYQMDIKSAFMQDWVDAKLPSSKAMSGFSRQEQRKPFERWLVHEASDVTLIYEFVYSTALALLARLTGDGSLLDLRVKPKLYLDVTKSNLETFTAQLTAYAQNLVSLETLIDSNPAVSDSDAEKERILAARANSYTAALELANVGAPSSTILETLKNAGYVVSDALVADARANEAALTPTLLPSNVADPMPMVMQ